MDGVEILTITPIETCDQIFFTISIILVIAGVIMFITSLCLREQYAVIGFAITLFLLLCSLISIVIADIKSEPTGIYEYKGTVDSSVSMTEFLDKYEIIDIDGNLYTFKDKEK